MRTIGRVVVVLALLFVLFTIAARGLTRDRRPQPYFSMTVSVPGVEPSFSWRYLVTQSGVVAISDRPSSNDEGQVVTFQEVLDRVADYSAKNAVFTAIKYDEGRGAEVWTYTANGETGEMAFAADAAHPEGVTRQLTVAQFQEVLRKESQSRDLKPTTQARIEDVLALNLHTPTLTAVSFPGRFTYDDALRMAGKDASPVTPEGTEVLVIRELNESPALRNKSLLPVEIRERDLQDEFPDNLPPVADRLPLYPAVVRGWEKENDGVGQYGGTWRRATDSAWDIERKIGAESFIRFGPSGGIQPGLAYKWKVEDNNRTFTFYLRKGHRWSDGQPFTAHDVVWVCNDVMESAYWGDMDPWMQKVDGSNMLYINDVKDWAAFSAALLDKGRSAESSVARQVWLGLVDKLAVAREEEHNIMRRPGEAALASEEHRRQAAEYLEKLVAAAADEVESRQELVMRINGVFTWRPFYSEEAWAAVDLKADLQAIEQRGLSRLNKRELWLYEVLMERNDLLRRMKAFGIRDPEEDVSEQIDGGAELIRMNQMLFRAGLRDHVVPPYFDRVIVETVADEDGDDSHIVRFRFSRPNSFFLEQTGTFMFYRGIFQMARHFHGPLHISGSNILNVIDILEWPEFLVALIADSNSQSPRPGSRVWALMSEEMKAAVSANVGKRVADYESGFQQQLVDELNRVLEHRDFYHAAAWETVNLKVEIDELLKKGFTGLRDPAQRARVLQIMQRDDFAKRGIDDLDDEEVYQFNKAMLRAAFSEGRFKVTPLMAYNREIALTIDANRHPRQFASWVTRMQRLAVPERDRIMHIPTLRPWRNAYDAQFHALAVRNPYYYRVDIRGNQLPYLDAVHTKKITEQNNVLLELTGGHVDAQWRKLEFSDFTVLKMGEEKGNYEIRLWAHDYVGELTFIPIQYSRDPGYAALQAQPQFRHALSMALNRQEIIDVIFSGIGRPAQWSIPVGSKYFNHKQHTISVEYNPQEAERLLDELGLNERDAMGMRRYPDGRPFIMEVSVTQDQKHVFDAVQMACNYWQSVGINAQMRQSAGDALTRWAAMGRLDMRVHKEGGSFFGPLQPGGYMPSHPAECGQWPEWTAWMRSGGRLGKEPPDRIKMLDNMWEKVMAAPTEEDKLAAWQVMADYTAEQLPIIGIMTSPGKVVYVHNNFKNVPKLALAGWIAHEPNNTCPEIFYKVKD